MEIPRGSLETQQLMPGVGPSYRQRREVADVAVARVLRAHQRVVNRVLQLFGVLRFAGNAQ